MERPQRDFKGIWIPKEIWEGDELSLLEKVIFVEIHSLDNERGCFASNAYFAKFFKISARHVARSVSSLKTKGFISVSIENLNERTIRVTNKYPYPNPQKMRELKRDVQSLTNRFSLNDRRRGDDKKSWGA